MYETLDACILVVTPYYSILEFVLLSCLPLFSFFYLLTLQAQIENGDKGKAISLSTNIDMILFIRITCFC